MSESTNLTDGREELKRQLAAGEHKSSIDVMLCPQRECFRQCGHVEYAGLEG